MATKTLFKTDMVSPAMIERAYEEALAAVVAIYTPQPVKGTTLNLCMVSRLARAQRIVASKEGQADYQVFANAMKGIEAELDAQQRKFGTAWKNYLDLCEKGMAKAKPTPMPRCECDGCQVWASEMSLRRATVDLLNGERNFLELSRSYRDAGDRELMDRMGGLFKAMAWHESACKKYGVEPEWQRAIFGR